MIPINITNNMAKAAQAWAVKKRQLLEQKNTLKPDERDQLLVDCEQIAGSVLANLLILIKEAQELERKTRKGRIPKRVYKTRTR